MGYCHGHTPTRLPRADLPPKPVRTRPTFADAEGRVWSLRLTLGDLDRIKDAAGVDLGAALVGGNALVDFLCTDPDRIGRAMWTACRTEAEAAGIDRAAFLDRFDAPTLWRAVKSLALAAAELFPSAGIAAAVRKCVENVIRDIEAGINAAVDAPANG